MGRIDRGSQKTHRKWGIGARFGGVTLLSVLVPTVLLGAWSARSIQNQARQETLRSARTLVNVIGFGLDAVLQDARRTLEVVASSPQVGGVFHDPGAARARLKSLANHYALFSDVYLLDPAGKPLLAARTESPGDDLEGFSPELADNYGGYVSDVFEAGPRKTPHIFMVVEVRGENLRKRGFLVSVIDLSQLYASLREAVGGEDGRALLIVDNHGRAIYPPEAWAQGESLRRENRAVDQVLSSLSEGHVLQARGGQEEIAVYKSMIGYNRYRGVRWGVILSQRTQDALAAADIAARNTIVVAVAVALIISLLSFALALWLSRPLIRLARYARKIGQEGVEKTEAPPEGLQKRSDEIGGLARSMSGMMMDLQSSRAELERRHEALRRAETMSSVGFLAAGVAHEINNPLTTILGYSQLLEEDKAEGDPDKAALELIASEAERVREIVRGLLEMSRRGHQRERFDPGEVIRRALVLSRAGLEMDEVEVVLEGPEGAVLVEADRQGVLQVVMNLLSNAVDALEGTDGPLLVLAWGRVGEGVFFSVEDNGEGMSAEVLSRIFEPFYTTRAPGKGTGLGMAILRRIVEEHRGQVEVESRQGRGARFVVTLPEASENAENPTGVPSGSV